MAEYNIYGVFEAGDIIRYGYMLIKRPPTSTKVRIKAWQSKFFVLRDKTHNLTQRLEYYKDETAFEFQKPAEYSFNLNSTVYIGETHSSKSNCYPIMIVCSKQGAITVACDTEKAMKDWLLAINRVAVKVSGTSSPDIWAHITGDDSPVSTPELQRRVVSDLASVRSKSCHNLGDMSQSKSRTAASPGYFVTTRLTPHSEKNNIRGDYILCVTEEEVSLQSADRSQTVVTWSVGHLRGFKSEPAVSAGMKDMQLLTLKVGRRSATGEGIFQFYTKHGDTIADEIRLHSQHAFKSAAEKRDAFRRSTNSSESRSPPSGHPTRKLPRTMTAPPERIANVLQKGISMDSIRRRAVTNPLPGQIIEQNGSVQKGDKSVTTDTEKNESVSSDDSRPRSVTESSVEKAGDDEVFLTRQTYTEIDGGDDVKEESETSAYVDLLSDETAEPIHISDPLPSRKTSSDSFTSSCSVGSEEGSMRSNSSLPRNFPGAHLIPEENEMDSEGYIKCEALQTGPAENSLDGNGNIVDYLVSEKRTEIQTCQISSSQSSSSCAIDTTTTKNGSLEISHVGSRVNRKMRESLYAQFKEPNCGNYPPKPKLEREQALKSENVFPPNREYDVPQFPADSRNEADSQKSLLDKIRAGDPEASKLMFEKIVAQMEKPQQNDVNELFPAARPKRNSIGGVSSDTVRDVQQRIATTAGGKGSHVTNKKHSVIEKTKSTSDGFNPRALSPGPPPLPLRPDPAEATRRRSSSSSIGDLSEEVQRRPELAAAHRSTFFAKGMRSIDPTILLLPHKTNIDTSHLTGEAAIHARLLEKTEMRDEQANQRRSSANSAVDEFGSCLIGDGGGTDASAFDSSEKGSCKMPENVEDDEVCKRKDSKASKFVKKVWKLAPKPRRGSNDSREVCEELPEKPRRDSLSPGDAMDIQARFSGSEPSTPETSPQMSRKASKSSPKSSRKTSREEKLKKDKESPEITRKLSSASKMLRKVTKGSDTKKDDFVGKKTSKEESLCDNTEKPLASPNKDKHRKWFPHEKTQKDSKEKKAKSNSESDEIIDASCEVDGQLELASGMTDSQCVLSNDNAPAPALPPRKKFDPPPLPPRQARSPTSFTSTTSPVHSSAPHHSGRTSQPVAPPIRDGRRHSGQKGIGSMLKEEILPPPPVPPRRENNQSPPDSTKVTSERSSARAAPVIQLTCSSPENQQDSAEKQNLDSEEDVTNATTDKVTEQNPPALSSTPQSPDSLSHPVPRRPPKPEGERRTQAKEFFRSHLSQRVCSPSSDSESADLEENASRYGNIDQFTLGTSASEHDVSSCKERNVTNSSTHEDTESNYINKTPSGPLSLGGRRVIKSQREAMRLKINLMKESSVDEDLPFEYDDGGITSVTSEGVEDQSTPKRPSTPLSIQRSPLTLSHISSVSIT